MKFHLVENAQIVSLLKPAADAAGRTSRYVTLKNGERAFIVVTLDQGNAATVLLSPLQASAVAGTGSKAVSAPVPIWAAQDIATSDQLARQTDATTFTTSAAVKEKTVVFQIDAASLDVNNGFDCVGISTGASNAANITSAVAYITGARYQQVTNPSAIVD